MASPRIFCAPDSENARILDKHPAESPMLLLTNLPPEPEVIRCTKGDWEREYVAVPNGSSTQNVDFGGDVKTYSVGRWVPRPLTEYEIKLEGFEFENVMCSGLAEDSFGLAAVQDFVLAGNPIPFEFLNGNKLVLHAGNFVAFVTAFATFRQSFFPLSEEDIANLP